MRKARRLQRYNARHLSAATGVSVEPTTGLHFEDIRKLLTVLSRLVDQGNTVLVIEGKFLADVLAR